MEVLARFRARRAVVDTQQGRADAVRVDCTIAVTSRAASRECVRGAGTTIPGNGEGERV